MTTIYTTATAAVRASKNRGGRIAYASESARATLKKWAQVDDSAGYIGNGWEVVVGEPPAATEPAGHWSWSLDDAGAPLVHHTNGECFRFRDCMDLPAMRRRCSKKGCPISIANGVYQWRIAA